MSNSGDKLKGLAASLSLPHVVRCCTSTSTFCCSTNSNSAVLQLKPLAYFNSNYSLECLWNQSSSSYLINCFTLLSLVWHMCNLACRLPCILSVVFCVLYIVCCPLYVVYEKGELQVVLFLLHNSHHKPHTYYDWLLLAVVYSVSKFYLQQEIGVCSMYINFYY